MAVRKRTSSLKKWLAQGSWSIYVCENWRIDQVIKRAKGAKIEEYKSNLSERPIVKVSVLVQWGEAVKVSTPRSRIIIKGSKLTKKAVLTQVVAYERGQV